MVAPPDGLGVVDVRDVAQVIAACLEPHRGPRRYLVTGNYVTWEEWTVILSEAAGWTVPFSEVPAEVMIDLGKRFAELRDAGQEGLPPLSVEAAVVMNSGKPADASATLRDLGVTYRPTFDTFRDTLEWLRSTGQPAAGD